MPKTITLRLDDPTYRLFRAFALFDNRSLSNLIETAAQKHLKECLLVDEEEMAAILKNASLVKRLRRGSRSAKAKRGRMIG